MAYEAEFEQAAARTRLWGLTCRPGDGTSERFVSPASGAKVAACVQAVLGHMQAEDVAAQCFAVSSFLREQLQDVLGIPLTYTLGYVNLGSGPVFYTPVERLKEMFDAGSYASRTLELHAWLTLPSREIIDLTLATTLGVVRDEPELLGRFAFIHPDELVGNQSYHPQLLGEAFLRRIGAMIKLDVRLNGSVGGY
ncbi:hypothetical protein [Burkholderia gladioli]|uniref:hypothetical protein n=1 Tax=Burkholderia gladioli TaxID=28095 RepID=UPI0016409F8A|nr:hypothetical protein [Burkholderia gladioli]